MGMRWDTAVCLMAQEMTGFDSMGLVPGMCGDMGDLWLINTSVDWLRNVAKKEIVLQWVIGDYDGL